MEDWAITIIKLFKRRLISSEPSAVPVEDIHSKPHFSTDTVMYAAQRVLDDGLAERKSAVTLLIECFMTEAITEHSRNTAHLHTIRPNVGATKKCNCGTFRPAFSMCIWFPVPSFKDDTQVKREKKLKKDAMDWPTSNLATMSLERSMILNRHAKKFSIYKGTRSEEPRNVHMSGTMHASRKARVAVVKHELVVTLEDTELLVFCIVYVLAWSLSLCKKEKKNMRQLVAVNGCAVNPSNAVSVVPTSVLKSAVDVNDDEQMTNARKVTLKTTRDMICSRDTKTRCSEDTGEVLILYRSVKTARLRRLEQSNDLRQAAVNVEHRLNEHSETKLQCRPQRGDTIEKHAETNRIINFINSKDNEIVETPLESIAMKYTPATDAWFVNCILPNQKNVCGDATQAAPSKRESDEQTLSACSASESISPHISRNARMRVDIKGSAVQTFYESEVHRVSGTPCAGVSKKDQPFQKGRLAFGICLNGRTTLPRGRMHDGGIATAKANSCICDSTCMVQRAAILPREEPLLSTFDLFCNFGKLLCAMTIQDKVYVLLQSEVPMDIYKCFIKCPSKLVNKLQRPRSLGNFLEFRELRLSKSDCISKDNEQDDSPFAGSTGVLSVKHSYSVQSKRFYSGRSKDRSMAVAHGCRRLELCAEKMPTEVDDEDAAKACFDISQAERCNSVPAKNFDGEDMTSKSIQPSGHDNESAKEYYESEKKAMTLKGNNGIIFNNSKCDCTSYVLELCPTSLSPGPQSTDIVAYPVHAVYRDSLLQKRVIAFLESHVQLFVFRLASFQTWPHLGKLSALRCCSAGFWRATTGGMASAGDHLACFSCGCTVSNWVPGVDPLALHEDKCGQHCSFISGTRRTETSQTGPLVDDICATERRAQKSIEVAFSPAACSASTEQPSVADWLRKRGVISGTEKYTAAIGAYRHAAAAVAASGSVMVKQLRVGNSLTGARRSEPSAPATDDELAKNESYRLSTFANVWAYDHIVTAEELARNGFLYAGPGDRVQCAFCQGLLRNWEPGDRADEQHAQHFTYCRFVQGHDVDNVPIPFWPLTAKPVNEAQSSVDATDGTGVDLGISSAVPSHPDFAVEARRLLTFATWPSGHHMQQETLAKAGFFYRGNEDAVQCFFCDCVVIDWRADCDPWVEHAQRSPDCPFVVQVKGRDFVRRHREDAGQAPRGTTTVASLAVDPREVRARMDSNMARILLQMDYPRDLVREVIQMRLAKVGSDHGTSEQLLDDVFQTHDRKQRASAAQNPAGCSTTPAVEPLVVCHQRWEAANRHDQTASRSTVATTTVTVAVAASAPIGAEAPELLAGNGSLLSGERVPLAAKLRSDEENRQLKTQLTCKICMDALVGIVFLPCGHLVCCAECAPAMKTCPICRVSVRGTVRTMT